MSGETPAPLVVGGWTLFAHPLFLDQVEVLIQCYSGQTPIFPANSPRPHSSKDQLKQVLLITPAKPHR